MDIGPDGVAVGLWMLAEAFVGVLIGLLAGGVRMPFAKRGEHPALVEEPERPAPVAHPRAEGLAER